MPQPPFSRTISEGSGDGAGLKVEGNTFSRPFGLDFLQDVISVQWNSGLFFATDDAAGAFGTGKRFPGIFYSKGGEKWTGPVEVDNSNFTDPARPAIPDFSIELNAVVGGKIHDGEQGKILLLGGSYEFFNIPDPILQFTVTHEILSYSYDGITWTPVVLSYNYDESDNLGNPPDIETILGSLLFIPETKLFYADVVYFDSVWARDLWSSGDGVEWSKVSSNSVPEDDVPDNPPFLCDFVKLAIETQDVNGFLGVTNPNTGTVIKYLNINAVPANVGGFVNYSQSLIRNGAPVNLPITVDGMCFVGGTFLVSGHTESSFSNPVSTGIVYKSTDDGKTWKQVLSKNIPARSFFFCGGA